MMNKYEKMARRVIAKILEDDTIKTVGGIAVVVGLGMLAKKYNVPINVGLNSGRPTISLSPFDDSVSHNSFGKLRAPMSSTEVAIKTVYENGLKMTWSDDKVNAARKIYGIVSKMDKEDSTYENAKAYAMASMSKLADNVTWSSDRETITDLIASLATK